VASLRRLTAASRHAAIAAAMAIAAALGALGFGVDYGARVAGGADALGYVSQSYLWRKGDLNVEQPLAEVASWPYAAESLSPLGYKPGAVRHSMVPTYAPGLPLLMAGMYNVCGPCGPFYVGPLFGALLVWGTYLLGRRITGSGSTGALAACLIASSPTVLINLVAPMSDVPTAALWTLALALLTWPGLRAAAFAGAAAGLATLVRPNLVVLGLACAVAAELWGTSREAPPSAGRRALAFLAALAPAAVAIAVVNHRLYGSAFSSGYLPLGDLYAASRLWTNIANYGTWLVDTQSVLVLLAVVPVVIRPARPGWLTAPRAVPLALFVAFVAASYLFYFEFDGWTFLRFFLPVYPLLFISFAAALVWLSTLVSPVVGRPALLLTMAFAIHYSLDFAVDRGIHSIGAGEARFSIVADYIVQHLPANAVIIGEHHTGTIAFYAGRTTLRHEYLPRQRLQSVVEWLRDNGHEPFIVLEEWEEPAYRRRFASGKDAISALEVRVLAETSSPIRVRIYDPLTPASSEIAPAAIKATTTRECPKPLGEAWR
jgi:hypothetical protein